MLRTCVSRSLSRSVLSSSAPLLVRTTHNAAFGTSQQALTTASRALVASKKQHATSLALTKFQPFSTSLQRAITTATGTVYDKIDHEAEMRIANQVIRPTTEEVTVDSSFQGILEERGKQDDGDYPVHPDDTDMLAGVKHDLVRPLSSIPPPFSLHSPP